MKVNLIIPSFYPAVIYGGPIFSTLNACKEMAKIEGVEVCVSTTNANMTTRLDVQTNQPVKFAENFFVKYYNETKINKFSLPLLFGLWKDIKNADVVHVQSIFSVSTPISLFYARVFKKPILLSPRGEFGGWCLSHGNRFKQQWIDWLIRPFIDNVIWHATAELEKQEILTVFPDRQVRVIPNGIQVREFKDVNILNTAEFTKKYLNQELEAEKIIVSMGRIHKKKGFDILIEAFADILNQYPSSKLFIAGSDEGEEKNLLKQISVLGLKDKVFLVGPISGQDKIDFLANADLFVLPSHNENFGNVYIESLAAGTPIVASTGTPWQEVEIADCGKWVDNTIEDTAKAMLEMLEKDREQMRLNARKLAQKYDWKNIALQFNNIFQEMTNE